MSPGSAVGEVRQPRWGLGHRCVASEQQPATVDPMLMVVSAASARLRLREFSCGVETAS